MELATDLNDILSKIEPAGGKILMPKTLIAPGRVTGPYFYIPEEMNRRCTLMNN